MSTSDTVSYDSTTATSYTILVGSEFYSNIKQELKNFYGIKEEQPKEPEGFNFLKSLKIRKNEDNK